MASATIDPRHYLLRGTHRVVDRKFRRLAACKPIWHKKNGDIVDGRLRALHTADCFYDERVRIDCSTVPDRYWPGSSCPVRYRSHIRVQSEEDEGNVCFVDLRRILPWLYSRRHLLRRDDPNFWLGRSPVGRRSRSYCANSAPYSLGA